MRKNILVFPCGSEIGLEIHNSVKYSTYFNLIGANSIDDHGKFIYDNYISGLPFVNENEIVPALRNIVFKYKIDAIYPTMDMVITKLKEKEEEIGCKIISSPLETVETCLSKEKTYKLLQNIINIPKQYNNINEIKEYPIFVKPKIGYGAIGTKKINNEDELKDFIKNSDNDNLILEYLPGEEYTIDCFTDKNGKMIYASARGRNRIKNGISVNTSFVSNQEEYIEFAKKVNLKMKFRGAWFVQVKRNKNGELTLLEVAARLGGSSSLCRGIGINFAQMTLFDFFDYDVNILKNDYNIVMDRAFDNVYKCDVNYDVIYVDYDDCLILDKNRVNTELVSFLYKSLNSNKKIILLTKHKGNLKQELKEFRILEIFDEIIHIEDDDEKYKYIKEANSIFIDDSFSERKKVKDNRNIFVFSPDMICTLL